MTNKTHNRLRVDLGSWAGGSAYAGYNFFAVANENDNYTLSLGAYSGK